MLVPTLTSRAKGTTATCTDPAPASPAALCSIVSKLCDAVLRALILLKPELSVCVIEPVLSSTSETQSFCCPQTTVEVPATLKLDIPSTFMSVVGIASVEATCICCPVTVTVTGPGVPKDESSL